MLKSIFGVGSHILVNYTIYKVLRQYFSQKFLLGGDVPIMIFCVIPSAFILLSVHDYLDNKYNS